MSVIPMIIKNYKDGGEALNGCYFQNVRSVIEFCDKNPTVVGALDGDVRLHGSFNFVLKDDPDSIWELTVTSITPEEIKGRWSSVNPGRDSDTSGSGGTFQAQAGGTGVPLPADRPIAKGKGTV